MNTVEIDGEQLTYEQAFRKQWFWYADHPEANKEDFFIEFKVSKQPMSLCFACESCYNYELDESGCDNCPVEWDEYGCNYTICIFKDTLYGLWRNSNDLKERSEYARAIANLPWNEKERD